MDWTLGPLDYILDNFFGLFLGLNFGRFFKGPVGTLVEGGGGGGWLMTCYSLVKIR